MPLTVCLVVMSRYIPQLRFITVLLADQPPLTPSERIYQRLLAFDYDEPLKFALNQLRTLPLVSFYDEVLIPAIVLAERDRHTGVLNTDQEEFLQDAAADLVDELGDQAADNGTVSATATTTPPNDEVALASDARDSRILCVPLRDQADEIASRMLAQLLAAEGFPVDTDAPEALTSEVVDHVAKLAIDVVVISILPPIAPRDSRLLWKRLRGKYPDLPIIVGFWSGDAVIDPLLPPAHDGATRVATKLSHAVALVRSMAAQRKLHESDSPQDAAIGVR
jgi:hypothetical protein